MGKWPTEQHVLTKLVENENAPVGARVKALKELAHPEMNMLRRLIVDSKARKTPVPVRLLAAASLAYAREAQLRKIRKQKKENAPTSSINALGIS